MNGGSFMDNDQEKDDIVCPYTTTGSCDTCSLPKGEKCPYED